MEALKRVHSSSSHSRMKDRKRPFLTIQAKTLFTGTNTKNEVVNTGTNNNVSINKLEAKMAPFAGMIDKEPPTIASVIKKGKTDSKFFAQLLKKNGITEANCSDYISYKSENSYTDLNSGKIVLNKNSGSDIKRLVIELTHELTNRLNLSKTQELSRKVERGLITPHTYAKQLEKSETDGEINQVKVAAEINYKYNDKAIDDLIEKYRNDPTIDLTKLIEGSNMYYGRYKKQGEELRANYLKYTANIQTIQGSTITFDSNVAEPSADKKYLTVKDLKTGKKHKVVRNPTTGTYSFYVVGNNKK